MTDWHSWLLSASFLFSYKICHIERNLVSGNQFWWSEFSTCNTKSHHQESRLVSSWITTVILRHAAAATWSIWHIESILRLVPSKGRPPRMSNQTGNRLTHSSYKNFITSFKVDCGDLYGRGVTPFSLKNSGWQDIFSIYQDATGSWPRQKIRQNI